LWCLNATCRWELRCGRAVRTPSLTASEDGPRLTDTHAHLEGYGDELGAVLDRAARAGVWRIVAVGSDAASSAAALDLARCAAAGGLGAAGPTVLASVGLHPHDASGYRRQAPQLAELVRRGAAAGLAVAVGETGLDYYRDLSPRADQRAAFFAQIGLALDHRLPVVVHDRDAHDDVLAALRSSGPFPAGGILHCFSGDLGMAQECIELGFLISFAGPLTFPGSPRLREIASELPSGSFVVETDCPYLAPQPYRGRRNEPAYVIHTAIALARARGETLEAVAKATEENADRVLQGSRRPRRA